MAGTVTWERLRELAAFRAESGCAISLYVNLDPSVAPTAGDAATRINSLLAEGEKRLSSARRELTHEQREGLKADLNRIQSFFENDFDRDGAHGLAVFAARLDNFWRPLDLPEAPADEIKIDREFYLAPLVPLVGRGDGAFVAVVSREQGRVYRLRAGRLEEVVDQSDDVPGQHDQGGWSQARFERHIDHLVLEHLKAVAQPLDRLVRRSGDVRIVVVCAEELRNDVSEIVAHETRKAIVGFTQAEAHAGPAELLAAATPILEDARARDEEQKLARWREEAGKNGRAASGWGPTLEAASDGRVDVLLFHEGVDRPAYQCPACGRAQLEDGSCPLDGTRMEQRAAGLDLAVHQTLAHGGSVWAVRHHRDLEPVEGIAALLRY
jgi:peptide chain release factor subunit 1